MNRDEYIQNWLKLADGDLKVAQREIEHRDAVLEAVCFHLQQSVEKCLKAYMTAAREQFHRTHNITYLLEMCARLDDDFSHFETKFDLLGDCSVQVRYPDRYFSLTRAELEKILVHVKTLSDFINEKIESLTKPSEIENLEY